MLPFVVDASLRITVAAGLVVLVLTMLRVRSAAARHAAWTAVLLTMVTMPVLTAIVPRIPVPVPSHLRTTSVAVAVQFDAADSDPLARFEETGATKVPAPPGRVPAPRRRARIRGGVSGVVGRPLPPGAGPSAEGRRAGSRGCDAAVVPVRRSAPIASSA